MMHKAAETPMNCAHVHTYLEYAVPVELDIENVDH
jgi:hypothetical protein